MVRKKNGSKLNNAIRVLTGVRLRVQELADVLEVSTSKVYRIFGELRRRGTPPRCRRQGGQVRYWLPPDTE